MFSIYIVIASLPPLGNTTFYAIPDSDTVARWVAQTPPGFEFCLKLPREITHQGLLELYIPDALSFVQNIQGEGDRPRSNRDSTTASLLSCFIY